MLGTTFKEIFQPRNNTIGNVSVRSLDIQFRRSIGDCTSKPLPIADYMIAIWMSICCLIIAFLRGGYW
jgi:hypothetical protein